MLRMSVAICEGSCKYRNMMVCPRKSTLVVSKPCILGCRFTSTVHTHDAHHVFAPKVRRSPQHEPKTGSWKSKVCMLSFWSGFLSQTYDRQKTMGRNWAYFQGHLWQVRRKEAITRHLMKKCPKYSEYPEDWSVLLSVFPLQKTSETHKI